MSTIRVEKSKDNPYVMLNKFGINDNNLSWKAKGILLYLLSKPDNWKCQVNDLIKHAKDGRDSTYAGLKELRANGYMIKRPVRDEKGRVKEWEEVLFEVPCDEAKLIFESQSKTKFVDNVEIVESDPLTENPEVGENEPNPLTDNQEMDNQDVGNQETEKPDINNNDLPNNNLLNNEGVKKEEIDFPFLIQYIEGKVQKELTASQITYMKDYWLSKISAEIIFWLISQKDFNNYYDMENSLIQGYAAKLHEDYIFWKESNNKNK